MTGARVLIVDDEPDMVDNCARILGRTGVSCLTALDGQRARDRLWRPRVAVVSMSRGDAVLATLRLEVADTMWRRARGLMGRTSLPQDGGMIFVYPWPRNAMLWMANTPLALDALFVDKRGQIASIAKNLFPFSRNRVRAGSAVRWVIEIPAGRVDGCDIRTGDQVRIGPAMAEDFCLVPKIVD